MTDTTQPGADNALDLAPCPFCGGKAIATTGFTTASDWPHGHFDRIFCGTCQVRQLFHRTKPEAIEAWNRCALIALARRAAQPVEAVQAYKPGQWFDARTLDEMQAFYRSRLPAIREAAKKHGYAIGLHGSERRDFDLIAMQWRDGASDRDTLARAIADAACGIRRDGAYEWEQKPAGRFAVSIPVCWTDHENPDFDKPSVGHIDLSVLATHPAEPAVPAVGRDDTTAIFPPELPKYMPDFPFSSQEALWDHAVLTGWRAAQDAPAVGGAPVDCSGDPSCCPDNEGYGCHCSPAEPVGGALVAMPDDLRAAGWMVAVHNDYRLNGEAHTFWLFTRDGIAVKGEGRTDAEALAQVRDQIGLAAPAGALVAIAEQHPDDLAVDRFAVAMKEKMAKSRAKGRGGWDDPTVCKASYLRTLLVEHIAKGDPVDVGNFAMMLFNLDEGTAETGSAAAPADLRETIVNAQADAIRGFVDAARETGVVTDPRFFVSAEKIIAKFREIATSQPIPTGEQ